MERIGPGSKVTGVQAGVAWPGRGAMLGRADERTALCANSVRQKPRLVAAAGSAAA